MIWALLLGATLVGLLEGGHDTRAARLLLVSVVWITTIALLRRALGEELEGLSHAAHIAGPPWGERVSFLRSAHLAYPVLATYAVAELGRGAVLLGALMVVAAITTDVWLGASWLDVAAGLALGKLGGWATFDRRALPSPLLRLLGPTRSA